MLTKAVSRKVMLAAFRKKLRFAWKRRATARLVSHKGSMLSHLLFNLTLAHLPGFVLSIYSPAVQFAIYTDDIALGRVGPVTRDVVRRGPAVRHRPGCLSKRNVWDISFGNLFLCLFIFLLMNKRRYQKLGEYTRMFSKRVHCFSLGSTTFI